MEEELLKVVYDYTYNFKTIDEDFFENIIEILCVYNNVEEHEINRILFLNDKNSLAWYSHKPRTFVFNLIKLRNLKVKSVNKKLFSSVFDIDLVCNLMTLRIILHEFEHFLQHRKEDNSKNDSDELKILEYSELFNLNSRNCLHYLMKKYSIFDINYKLYNKYHDYFPSERMANINSYNEISNICSMLSEDIDSEDKILSYFKSQYFYMLALGYQSLEETGYPVSKFLHTLKHPELLGGLSFYSEKENETLINCKNNYNLDERLLYGFPIDINEKRKLYKVFSNEYNKVLKLMK